MEIILNHFMFFVAFLFNLETPVLATHTCLEIDIKKKEFRIEYEDLLYIDHPKFNDQVGDFIQLIDNKSVTLSLEEGVVLKDVKFNKGKNAWDLSVNGTFEDLETILDPMKIRTKEDKIIYREFREESIKKSNGQTAVDAVIWDKDVQKIKLSLERKRGSEWEKSLEENQGKLRKLSEFK